MSQARTLVERARARVSEVSDLVASGAEAEAIGFSIDDATEALSQLKTLVETPVDEAGLDLSQDTLEELARELGLPQDDGTLERLRGQLGTVAPDLKTAVSADQPTEPSPPVLVPAP